MSFRSIRNAFKLMNDTKLTAKARLVLLVLSNHHNQDTGRCDPSIARIASQTNLAVSSVRRALRELEREKAIATVHRRQRTGLGVRNLRNRYRLISSVTVTDGVVSHRPPKQEIYKNSGMSQFDDLVNLVDGDENE